MSSGTAAQLTVLAIVIVLGGCVGALGQSDEQWQVTEASDATGIDYEGVASGVGNGNSGVYVSDFDRDGRPDLLAIGGSDPVLYRNVGDGFERADVLPPVDGTVQGALFFDADGDGREDLLLLRRHAPAVFLRNTGERFVTDRVGLEANLSVPVGATTADYDGDGDLDVFVVQYGDWATGSPDGYFEEEGYIAHDNGNPNLLFENTDDGFVRVTEAGIDGDHWSLAASFVDLTADGRPDLHVANDFNNDIVYVNTGDGFDRRVLGSATARNGMSSEVADFDGDGRPDIFVTNIFFPLENLPDEKGERLRRYFDFVLRSKRVDGNTLLYNRGGGTFDVPENASGLRRGGWGWAAIATDLDNDGHRDVFHATQWLVRLDADAPRFTYPMLWRGGSGEFERLEGGDLGFVETDGRGAAELDYDCDGDMDIVVASYDDRFVVYENNADTLADRHALQLRVLDRNGAPALGAVVEVTIGERRITEFLTAKADYQSQDTRLVHVGVGSTERLDRVNVVWPDGTERTFTDVETNHRLVVGPDGLLETVDLAGDGGTCA